MANENPLSNITPSDTEQQLTAAELMTGLGMTTEATALLRKLQITDDFRDVTQRLKAAEVMSHADMTSEAVALLLKIQASGELRNVSEQLSAAELMSRIGMTTEAGVLLKKVQASGELKSRPDLKKRADELASRLAPATNGKAGETIKL